MAPKWRFDVDISRSKDQRKWILKYDGGGSQDNRIEPYDQVVKVREGWVDLEPCQLQGCQMSKYLAG